jgi:hypothetical protein
MADPGICSAIQNVLSSIDCFSLTLLRSSIMYWLLYVPEIQRNLQKFINLNLVYTLKFQSYQPFKSVYLSVCLIVCLIV